ncbi:NADH dehydrogenase [ubiquinone] 1 subunit C2-like [Arvicanthis niloticus]|uniref:NADH dehydrogenase [ubiquinone] 1 subunit C2-like n=1 Tax=Arvicanthis niloticus TaxID=61156 RepID=UPI00402B0CF0
MMNGWLGHKPLKFLPDEARSLPLPKLNDLWLVYIGLLDNLIRKRPVMKADYLYAVKDHDMFGYIKLHPEDFPEKEKKSYAEILEAFHPVR